MPEKKAGLDVLRIVNEPTAASLVHGLEKANNETILVFDLGGVAFDVSVLEVGDGVCEVLATNGDTNLGGDDFDKVIVDWLEGIDFLKDRQALQRLTGLRKRLRLNCRACRRPRSPSLSSPPMPWVPSTSSKVYLVPNSSEARRA